MLIAAIAAIILAPIAAQLIQLAVSRRREFLADARAVQWTRYPLGMLGVLRKIQCQQTVVMADPHQAAPDIFDVDLLERQQPLIAHMLLVEPPARKGAWLQRLFDSHPPLAQRIERLHRLL